MAAATFDAGTLARVVELISSGACRNIAFLTGAGISVAAGIPDFRSPGGMYDTLRPELLTAEPKDQRRMAADPTFVVNKELFMRNAFPYLELRRPFILGIAEAKWKATNAHYFMRLVHERGLLRRVYTQNIDGLDAQTMLPQDKLVPVHGSLGLIACESCGMAFPGGLSAFCAEVKLHIRDIYGIDPSAPTESTPILCPGCGKAAVKPATVLYGGQMPPTFMRSTSIDFPDDEDDEVAEGSATATGGEKVDLLIVIGTSLTVGPANLVPRMAARANPDCIQVLINQEPVGAFTRTSTSKQLFLEGPCEATVNALIAALGWTDALARIKDEL